MGAFTRSIAWSFVCSFALVFALTCPAQQPPTVPGDTPPEKPRDTWPVPSAPAVRGDDGKPISGVSLVRAAVHTIVRGPLAEANITLTFRNTQDRVLGGELTFPLPDGATVSGYALDIHGEMVEGVAIEKDRARVIYETEMNKVVDPGLVEHVVGNNFRTRLYPIPANGTRSIRVSYVTELSQPIGDKGATLSLPLGLSAKLEQFDLTVAVEGATVPPVIRGGDFAAKPFHQVDRGYYLKESLRKAVAADTLIVSLPEVPATSVTVETVGARPPTVKELAERTAPPPAGGHFVITDKPAAPFDLPLALANQRILVVWDASLSRRQADLNTEIDLLAKALAKLKHPAIDLLFVRNDVELKPGFGPGEKEAARAIEAIRNAVYDGATNLGLATFPKNVSEFKAAPSAKQSDYDLALLFTDGLTNLGVERMPTPSIPVWAVSSSALSDHPALRTLCERSGGAYLNLTQHTARTALDAIGQPPLTLLRVEADAAKVADLLPAPGTTIAGRLTLAGRLLDHSATVTLVYGQGVTEMGRRTFTIKASDGVDSALIAKYWAQQKAAHLAQAGDGSRDELLALGKTYGIVTPVTSLLVLETIEQYVQYGVVPPKSKPDFVDAYYARAQRRQQDEQQAKARKLEEVVRRWNDRVSWWQHDFRIKKGFRYVGEFSEDPRNRPKPTFDPPVIDLDRANDDVRLQQVQGVRPPDFNLDTNRDRRNSGGQGGGGGGGGGLFGGGGGGGGDRGAAAIAPRDDRPAPPDRSATVQTSAQDAAASRIKVKPWNSKAQYLAIIRTVSPERAYNAYLIQRDRNDGNPSFFLDCGEHLLRIGRRAEGLRVLSNVLEITLDDARLIRIVAHRFQAMDELDLAIMLFEKVARLRPEEPQSFRDLALALAARADKAATTLRQGHAAGARPGVSVGQITSDYTRALELLNKVVTNIWQRNEDIESVALMEANRIIATTATVPGIGPIPNPLDARLVKNLDCDIRIVLNWDADQTNIDLWIAEPSTEYVGPDNPRSSIGGAAGQNVRSGYGPEEYFIRKAMPGEYKVRASYYGSRQQELTGACTVQATVITNFGRPDEKRQNMILRLSKTGERVMMGKVTVD